MSVDKTPTGVVYTVTNGTAGQQYPLTFPYIKGADVKAYYVANGTQNVLTYGTHYTVVDQTFVTSVALPVGAKLAIYRQTDLTQEIVWKDGQAVYTPDIMKADDKLTLIAQEIAADMSRTVKLTREEEAAGGKPEEVMQSIYGARDAAAASASEASAQASAAQASANEAKGSAGDASSSATAAALSAAEAEAASAGLAPRMDAVEIKNTQQDTRLESVENGVTAISTTLIGSIQKILCTDSYVPNGCVPANGAEYTSAQFPTFFGDYLAGGKLLTCTYAAWTAQVAQTGNCAKFAFDATAQKFKVPLLKDGDSITQAASAAELGKSYKAGLPNIVGRPGLDGGSSIGTGAFSSKIGSGFRPYGQVDGSYDVTFDANRVSPVYRNDVTTVLDEQIRLRHFVVVASAQNSPSVFEWSAYMAALAGKANTDLSNVTGNALGIYLYARDEKASAVNGGTYAGGTWATRDLNKMVFNFIPGASLTNNRIDLPAGRYKIDATVPAYAVNFCRAALYNATSATYILYGPSERCDYSYNGYVHMRIRGEFTLATASSLEVRMWGQSTYSSGMGLASGVSGVPEIYTEVEVWKM